MILRPDRRFAEGLIADVMEYECTRVGEEARLQRPVKEETKHYNKDGFSKIKFVLLMLYILLQKKTHISKNNTDGVKNSLLGLTLLREGG